MGMLRADEALAVAQHVASCPHCRREISQLTDFMAQEPPIPDEGAASLGQRVRILVARLVSGGRALGGRMAPQPALAPAFAGLRGENAEPVVLAADGLQITLEVEPDPRQAGCFSLVGLVIGLDMADGAEVTLWRNGQRLASAAVDALGNFALSALPRGNYELILTAPGVEVHVQELSVA
ncbi:MAG: carboxypeptidase-like regulatory domain-containing protein [Caldilineales bacterium]|nr:carboxypeptidase-like regulatory domain-containing protein [Caldilineales bacterium]